MNILFWDGSVGNFMERRICDLTGGPYCHAEIQYDDGKTISALMGHGVLYTTGKYTDLKDPRWKVIKTPWHDTQEARNWAETQIGMPFSYWGGLKIVHDKVEHVPGKWFCSEISAAIVTHCNIPGIIVPIGPSPMGLYNWLVSLGYAEIL